MVDPQCGSSDITQSTLANEIDSAYSSSPMPLNSWNRGQFEDVSGSSCCAERLFSTNSMPIQIAKYSTKRSIHPGVFRYQELCSVSEASVIHAYSWLRPNKMGRNSTAISGSPLLDASRIRRMEIPHNPPDRCCTISSAMQPRLSPSHSMKPIR